MKLLIADDEPAIRLGLVDSVDWAELGIDRVLSAGDGLEALALCQSERPEIVITDIRMPGLDGLELGERLAGLYHPVRVVILSGYSEFSYAQSAVKLGAIDYMLKPVNIDELKKRVGECAAQLRSDLNRSGALDRLRAAQCRRRVSDWLARGGAACPQALCALDGLDERGARLCATAAFDRAAQQAGDAMSLMRARMEEALSPYGAAFLYADADAAVFSCPARHARRETLGALKTLMVSLNGLLMSRHKVSVSVALSGPCDAPQFALGHAACLTALEHRLYLGPCQALDAPLFKKPPSVPYIPYDEATLRAQVRVFSYAGASKRLEALFARLRHERLGDVRAARALCASLKRLLYETLRDKGIDMEALLAENPDIFDEPRNFVLLDDYYAWCDTLYYLVLGGLNQLSGRASSRCTVQAVDYIARHLGENLSLESVAEAVGKSKNYFPLDPFRSAGRVPVPDRRSRRKAGD